MELYAIIRRKGWPTGGDLEEAAGRSSKVGDEEMSDDIRWIRSYVLSEDDGSVGTLCIYEASSPEGSASMPRGRTFRWTRSSRSPIRCS